MSTEATVLLGRLLVYAAVLGSIILFGCGPPTAPPPVVHRTVDNVQGFEFEVKAANPHWGDRWRPAMGLGYVVWANYPFFVYNGETFERAGPGGVIIRRGTRDTHYLVRETVEERDESRSAARALIEVIDKRTREVIAARVVLRGEVESGTGWEGEHGAMFIRSVLRPPGAIGGPIGVKDYRLVTSTLESLGEQEVPLATVVHDCPPEISLEPGGKELRSATWRLRVQNYVIALACVGNRVVLFSPPENSRHTAVDVVSLDGEYLWEADVPIGYSGTLADRRAMRIERVSLKGDRLEFEFFLVPDRTLPDVTDIRAERKRVVSHLNSTRDPSTRFTYLPPPPASESTADITTVIP